MKQIYILLLTVFLLSFLANPVIADRGSGHGGYSVKGYSSHGSGHGGYKNHSYSGNRHSNHWVNNRWEAAAIGLGAIVVGSAVINSYPRERVTVVEHKTYYQPAPPQSYDCPSSYRVWNPGHYVYERGGHYTYVRGCWVE